MIKDQIWIVGTGLMGIEYAKVLNDLGTAYTAIGRSAESCEKFSAETGHEAISGGLEKYLSGKPGIPAAVNVAVGIEALAETTTLLLGYGVKYILVEKPAVGYAAEIDPLYKTAQAHEATVLLAYNRRFYASVLKAKELIEKDGGVTSFHFEFTEWAHVIGPMKKHPAEHRNWFLGNSTHVIDTAFFLCGKPKEMHCFKAGHLDWHPSGSVYSGAGNTANGALFSYIANWGAPGRWNLEIMTGKHRFIMKPMEKLQVMKIGSVAIDPVEDTDYSLDEKFKPGLYLQTRAFLNKELSSFCDLGEQAGNMAYYKQMSGY